MLEYFIAGEGPCFDAARTSRGERVFRISDLTDEHQRWPAYAPQARALGVGSMMGFLLFTEDEDLGALNLYSREPGAFTETSELVGWLLASHAAVAFSSARTHAQMEQAVATRHVVGEAMGILMGRDHVTEKEAFDMLRHSSPVNNRPPVTPAGPPPPVGGDFTQVSAGRGKAEAR